MVCVYVQKVDERDKHVEGNWNRMLFKNGILHVVTGMTHNLELCGTQA